MTQAKFPMLLDEERAKYVNREIAYEQTIESLREQLAGSQKREAMLRDVLDDKQWEKDGDVGAHNNRVQEALAATADLDGLILCDAEPVGYDVTTMDGKKILMRSFCHIVGHKSEPLYRAWEPKQ